MIFKERKMAISKIYESNIYDFVFLPQYDFIAFLSNSKEHMVRKLGTVFKLCPLRLWLLVLSRYVYSCKFLIFFFIEIRVEIPFFQTNSWPPFGKWSHCECLSEPTKNIQLDNQWQHLIEENFKNFNTNFWYLNEMNRENLSKLKKIIWN